MKTAALSVTAALVLGAAWAAGQPLSRTGGDPADVVSELLLYPALPSAERANAVARPDQPAEMHVLTTGRTAVSFAVDPLAPPAGDAPVEALATYWTRADPKELKSMPPVTRKRLLDACLRDPERAAGYIPLLIDDASSHEALKRLYDENAARLGRDWRDTVRKQLKLRAGYFRDELAAEVAAAKDDDEAGSVENEEELTRLAQLDWTQAEPILQRFAANPMPRRAVLAKTLLLRHYTETGDRGKAEGLRRELQAVAGNRKALGYSRSVAAETLLAVEWPEREEWFLKLFADPTIRALIDGYYLRTPLAQRVGTDPERWIPQVARLVGAPDRATHDNAVECLIQFHLTSARRDALVPLLPWLLDPKWSSARDRLRLIQTVPALGMREAIPGLVAVLNQNVDEAERAYAAESLLELGDGSGTAELRRALPEVSSPDYRRKVIAALVAAGGVSDTEAVAAVEAYADRARTEEGAADLAQWFRQEPLPVPVSIGQYLAERASASEAAAVRLLERAQALDTTDAPLAQMLREVVHSWPLAAADHDVARRLRSGTVAAPSIARTLLRRDSFRAHCPGELTAPSSGIALGFFGVLAGDHERERGVLYGTDEEAKRALLAAARLVGEPLPLEQVATLLGDSPSPLATAARAYLEAEDSPQARRLLTAGIRGEIVVAGARPAYDPGHYTFQQLDRLESELIRLVSGGEADEVLALLSAGYWGNAGQILVVRQGDTTTLRFSDDPARVYERALTGDELRSIEHFVENEKADDLAPFDQMASDGMQYEYLHLRRNEGRRVFMNNPGLARGEGTVYERLCGLFQALLGSAPLTVAYPEASATPGFKVVVADARLIVVRYWAERETVRLQVLPRDDGDARAAFTNLGSVKLRASLPEADEPLWVGISEGTLVPAEPPAAFPDPDPDSAVPESFDMRNTPTTASPFSQRAGRTVYRVGNWRGESGLWRFEKGRDPRCVARGQLGWPVLSPDGHWALLARAAGSWAEPNTVARVDLSSETVDELGIERADTLLPLAYVPELGRFLVWRAADQVSGSSRPVGPQSPEFWLVDPDTGRAEVTPGEVRPLTHLGPRPLQPAGAPGRYWAALATSEGEATEIGVYDVNRLNFASAIHVPGLVFDSQALWVDASRRTAYVVYRGQLLSVDLPKVEPGPGEKTASRTGWRLHAPAPVR